jgi:hypothetical protein
MGNLFSTSKYSLKDIPNLKNTLGTLNEPVYTEENRPSDLIGLFGESCPLNVLLSQVYVPSNDKELLNRFLTEIHNHLKENYNSDFPFPQKCEGGSFIISNLDIVSDLTDEHLETLNDVLSIGVDKTKIKTIKSGHCIYKFNEDSMKMYDRIQLVPIENSSVGVYDGDLMVFSSTTEPEETRKICFRWWIYELENGEVYVVPTFMEGVQVDKDKQIIKTKMNHIGLLEEASVFLNENNDRSMKSKLDAFNKWKNEVIEKGEVNAIVGGIQIGDMDTLPDFFERLEIME